MVATDDVSNSGDSLRDRFVATVETSFRDGSFVRLTLTHPRLAKYTPQRLNMRPVIIRAEKRCCVVSVFPSKEETKNYSFVEASALVEENLKAHFLNASLLTESSDVHLELGKTRRLRISHTKRKPANLAHDRMPARWIDAQAPYLRELGVTDARGKVRERMGSKFRQIERFVDLLHSAFRESSLFIRRRDPITMCDMGSGKGYLTFAAYDYFRRSEQLSATVWGVESRRPLVTFCNVVAERHRLQGLRFIRSEIAEYELPPTDILVALHACDTATDDAISAGVNAGAEIILVAPCCHKEARRQVERHAAHSPLHDVLRHGIFAERQAEMATDVLRALLLEHSGYRVRVTEFVAAEHTAKNIMLVAVKRPNPISTLSRATIHRRLAEFKKFYGIEQHRLERLLLG